MTGSARTHRLTDEELRLIAGAPPEAGLVSRLGDATQSKHRLLLAEVMRRAPDRPGRLDRAYCLLGAVERSRPDVVTRILGTPQFGTWSLDCLRRLTGMGGSAGDPPLDIGLGHLAVFAAAAALSAGRPFDLEVPVRDRRITIPVMGTVQTTEDVGQVWARVGGDGGRDAGWVRWPSGQVVPMRDWTPPQTVVVSHDGLALRLTLDDREPYLDRYGRPRCPADAVGWQPVLAKAWRLLVSGHRATAEAMAATLTTLVPLRAHPSGRPVSASSGAAFGAIAMSLPTDEWILAERLVHEFQHVVLGAVMDLCALADRRAGWLGYAPWRPDPRPAVALLQGCFAYLGVTGFWLRHSRLEYGRPDAQAQFARWREACQEATMTLAASGRLTGRGATFVDGMQERLRDWGREPLDATVARAARRANLEHRLSWRLANLRPDPLAVEILAADWRGGTDPALPVWQVPVAIAQGPRHLARASRPGEWAELALTGGAGVAELLRQRIEVVAALQERLRRTPGPPADAASIIGWLLRGPAA